jgi:hypothetical protein
MTAGNAKLAILATFGCLAIFYLGSVLFQVSSLGWGWVLDAAKAERSLAYSLALRIVGGTISSVVFALVFAGSRWEKIRASLAWILAFGVAIVVVIDNLLFRSDPTTPRALVWLIAAAIIGVHFFGAIVAQRGMAK